MLQLIYMSLAREQPTFEGVGALAEQSARNNDRDEVTGVLLVQGLTFLQVLEGPRRAVENAFLRIMADRRHHSLLLLSRKLTTTREFGGWAMALCDLPTERKAIRERVRSRLVAAPEHLRHRFEQLLPEA